MHAAELEHLKKMQLKNRCSLTIENAVEKYIVF